MSPLVAIFLTTCRQLSGLRKVIGLGLLALIPTLIFVLVTRTQGVEELDDFFATLLMAPYFSILVPVIALVVAGGALGDERTDGTLAFLVLRPISRFGIAGAKTLAAAVTIALLTGIGALGLAVAYLSFGGTAAVLPGLAFGVAVTSLTYGAVFTLLGFVASRAMLVGLVYVFVIENTLVNLLPRLATLSPWRIGFSGMAALLPEGFDTRAIRMGMAGMTPDAPEALLRAGVTALVTIVVLGILLRRRDAV